MPKYHPDKRRYYDNMGDQERSRQFGRHRGRSRYPEQRDDRSQSRQIQSTHTRRPGEAYTEPSTSHSTPYARPSSSTAPDESFSSVPGTSYPATSETFIQHRVQSESTSETPSPSGPVTGGESSAGRGSMRGGRLLPVDIITRPRGLVTKQGGFGQPIHLQANYFKLLNKMDWCLYKYSVDFTPDEDRNIIRKGLLRPHSGVLGAYIFDGSVLYTTNKLPDPLELASERKGDKEMIIVKLRPAGDMVKGDHHYLQFFNIIMRKCLTYLKLQLVGRNYFDAQNKAEVREYKLELWPGYITSIRQHEDDILMCAEITHKVMRNDTLLDVLNDCHRANRNNYMALYKQQILGAVVLTDYNNNTYRIDDVDFNVSPSCKFTKKTGEEISYIEYYMNRYNIKIQNVNQPLLVSRSRQRDRRAGQDEIVYLVPELCRSTGLTDGMRSNHQLMAAIAKFTRVQPCDRIKKLMTFNRRLHSEKDVVQEFKNWNLNLDTQLVNVPGRVFPPDLIIYGNEATSQVPNNVLWTRDMRNKNLRTCGVLENWALVIPEISKRDCESFIRSLIEVAHHMNFKILDPKVYYIREDSPATYANILERIKSQSNPMLILCVATNNRVDRYSAIKKKCCVDRPVPSQVVLSKSLRPGKSQKSIATKVAIQMNCKIGGIPWTVKIPLQGLMVVGFDVCHDTNSKEKDFGAMVASLDVHFGRYFSAVSSHRSGEELSSTFTINLFKALTQFKECNNSLPKRIVIYRDGVGEGQVPFVVKHEIQQIRSKLEEVYGGSENLKFAYIIVTKKINTRLFFNNNNPPPGTVVDSVITDPTRYDFLIVSQHVDQGTVSPTAYNVVSDTSGLDVDKIQRLTYKLCHLYFNWSGTVRVPAPCQYAHKLAFLISQSIHQSPSTALETLLYFL